MLEVRRLATPFVLTTLAVILLLCLEGFWSTRRPSLLPDLVPITPISIVHQSRCAAISDLQDHIELPKTFRYGFRKIISRTAETAENREPIARLQDRLMPEFVTLDVDNCATLDDGGASYRTGDELTVDSPPSTVYDVDHSTILFGASTSLERLEQAIPQLTQWLGGTNASLVVNVADSEGNGLNMTNFQDSARSAGMDLALLPNADRPKPGDKSEERHGQRHFSIVKLLQDQRKPHHKWFGIIDDDTFFPSLSAVLAALQNYDPDKPYYIGGLTEDRHALTGMYGYMAYGGAGMFISGPLLDAVVEHFDECITELEGDMIYRDCIYRHTYPPVQLTVLPGLHQVDFRGDASGWYEAGPYPLLSLHHWNSRGWHLYPIHYGHLVSKVCGVDCFLQRYRFADDVVLTNGYSVAQYPGGVDNVELERVEATFMHDEKDPEQWEFSVGRLRPRLKADEKISWRLEYALKEEDGTVRQFYIRRAGDEVFDSQRLKQDVVGVFEVEWKT